MDAFQRANFWSAISIAAPDYHVLLAPTVAPPQTILVPGFLGTVGPGACAQVGRVALAVNGWYTFLDTFAAPPEVCP